MVIALQHGTWIDEESLIKENGKRGGIHQPLYGTWAADFMRRQKSQGAGKFMMGKHLSDTKIRWKRRRRLGMAAAENMPIASFAARKGWRRRHRI